MPHIRIVLLVNAVLFLPLCTQAAVLQVLASGTIAESQIDPSIVGIPNGTTWSLNAQIPLSTEDQNPASGQGNYSGITGTVFVGVESFSLSEFSGNRLEILDAGAPGVFASSDFFVVRGFTDISSIPSDAPAISDWVISQYFLSVSAPDREAGLFGSDELGELLGVTLADLSSCLRQDSLCYPGDGSSFGLQLFRVGTGRLEILGGISELSVNVVPIPASAWLLVSALCSTFWASIRAKR